MKSISARRLLALVALVALLVPPAKSGSAATKKSARLKKPSKARPIDYAHARAVLKTSQGEVTIRFFYDKAPNSVKSFLDLAASGFYDGTLFHRVIPGFVIQGGDPSTREPAKVALWGLGGHTDAKGNLVNVKSEFSDTPHRRGIVSMARMLSDPDSASSQFFIVLKDAPSLDRKETAFGEVTLGMDVVDRIALESNPDVNDPRTGGKPRNYQKILKIELAEAPAGADGKSPEPKSSDQKGPK